jgi:glycosyltransferase involved in cell wall biosynthesis
MLDSTVKFSIITIVYNRVNDIEFTLKSITGQTYPNIEYIVIDGKSNDGTTSIIEKYSDKIDCYISEKDQGIYDAMNKGLRNSTGDYVLFINGGDSLHQKDTIEKLADQFINKQPLKPDIVFGECMLVDFNRNPIQTRSAYKNQVFPRKLEHHSFKFGTNVSHQSFIVKRSLAPFYNLKYHWSSDVDWMLNCIKASKNIVGTNEIFSDFVFGDSSEIHKISSLKERFYIMSRHYGFIKNIFYHLSLIIKKIKI